MSDSTLILIIDDEIDLCFLLKDYLTRMNFQVLVAHSLAEGRTLLDQHHPAILFIDNNLPDGTGWNFASEVAAANPGIKMMLIGAMNAIVPEMPANADFQVLPKPIGLAELDSQFARFRNHTPSSLPVGQIIPPSPTPG